MDSDEDSEVRLLVLLSATENQRVISQDIKALVSTAIEFFCHRQNRAHARKPAQARHRQDHPGCGRSAFAHAGEVLEQV